MQESGQKCTHHDKRLVVWVRVPRPSDPRESVHQPKTVHCGTQSVPFHVSSLFQKQDVQPIRA